MSQPSILSENQKKLLDLLSHEKLICANFYLTGGTALAEFYLHHRLSEDLDFFSEQEFDPQSISVILKKIQKAAGVEKIEYQQSFNRNLFFLHTDSDIIKTEFTYFPFTCIEQKQKMGELFIDSLIDIATNKLFTIYQKPRSRDFIDLYLILTHDPTLTLNTLIDNAQIKFDSYIDPIQLGAQYVRAEELKDYPRMLEKLDKKAWQEFFLKEAEKLSEKVFE
ncbi:MAG: nucleotidyl transferase AbiEii/AbiGii toxin family protein [bacterium]|nr:nucleotidyl transferase AbiEii/AbiGii toxin family protein [bacterium]MDZ4299373.1 nucleotidyl transferase AbiEii/AbiGii toxin family protein [Candidatus Sungbacteria bacterium]